MLLKGVADCSGIPWRNPPESGGGMKRNWVALSNGIRWRLAPEYAVIGTKQPHVDDVLRRGMPRNLTSPTLIVAPYYGADQDGKRAGYNPKLVDRIRHAEYPQFMLDYLPIPGPEQSSILRFDHIQPVGLHYHAYEHSGFCLSDEAVELILDDWLQWLFYGGLPENSLILDYQKEIMAAYG